MEPVPTFNQNPELFESFRHIQGRLTERLALNPFIVRAWLESLPKLVSERAEGCEASKSWRTARLNAARRADLAGLIGRAEREPAGAAPLAHWLHSFVPARTYLDIADAARPNLRSVDPEADALRARLMEMREILLRANYGLARTYAGRYGRREYEENLSAASAGLLDAIDRYAPGPRAARFSYFANYWMRYHMNRDAQKHGSLVSFPVNRQRLGARIGRFLANRRAEGLPPPSEAEMRAELKVGPDACLVQGFRPMVVSLESPACAEADSPEWGGLLRDPGPAPAEALDARETATQLRRILEARAAPAARVMLAYTRLIGSLPDAAEDYLADLERQVRERIGTAARRAGQALADPRTDGY